MANGPAPSFGGLLRQLRDDAGLTQEELAEAASLSPRSISDLERGVNRTARKDTAALLADALGLAAPVRMLFVAAARGRAPAVQVLAARDGTAAGISAAAATRALPRDIASFTGRGSELAQLIALAGGAASEGVRIHVIGGMAGIGKTTLVVHAAHQLTPDFPDGQFFLPLHGHTPGQRPVDPAGALASLLLTAGIGAQNIPPDPDARAARWRDYLAGKKILLVLDDAAGHEQVRPLLPGTGGSLVLVTSRRRLTALEDAAAVSLDTLAPGEAAVLLARLAGRPGVRAGDTAVGEITRLCGYLPLAIGMLGRQLHQHPAWTAAGLATDLAAARDRLEVMQAENLSVAAAFDLSYQDLTPGQQRLFRRLGVHPGPDIDPYAAAALDDTDLAAARRHLEGLYDQHLITEPARGRYCLHDLLREHARTLAAGRDPADAAAGRLLDYYLHTASAADQQVPSSATSPGVRPPPGRPPAQAPRLSTATQAAAWLETERPNLHAAAGYAAASGQTRHAIAIPAAIGGFLLLHGHLDQAAALHQGALTAARQAGDPAGQAGALYDLGNVQHATGDYPAAATSLTRALGLFGDLGDRAGQAGALSQLGALQLHSGDYPAAAATQQQALALYRDLGHRPGEASALNWLGMAQWQTGNYPAAATTHQQALELFRDLGDRLGQANALTGLGTVQELTGDYPAAAASLTQALGLFRDIGDRLGLAEVLTGLGSVQQLTGDYPAAAATHQQALALYRGSGDRIGQAGAYREIGIVQRLTGDYPAAATSLTRALAMFRDHGDRIGQAGVHREIGIVQQLTGDYPAAAASYQQALQVHIDLGDRHGQAAALNNLGDLVSRSAPTRQAREYHSRALAIARDIGTPLEEARALEGTGHCQLRDGDPSEAAAHLRQALAIYQRIGAPDARRVQESLRHGPP